MAVISDLIARKKNQDNENESIVNELHSLSQALERAYERFELQSDSNLVEATIFEIEALKARYRYLLALAKEQKLTYYGKQV